MSGAPHYKISFLGAKGSIADIEAALEQIERFSKERGVCVELLDADAVAGRLHLEAAAEHALRSFARGENVSQSIGKEIMLYAAGERQIKSAVKKMGISAATKRFVVVLACTEAAAATPSSILSELGLKRDDAVIDAKKDVFQRFGISGREIEASGQDGGGLILEKVAFVDIIK